jgi:hypothetical protein
MMNLGDAGTPCGCMDARIARGNQIQISGLSDIFTVLPAFSSVIENFLLIETGKTRMFTGSRFSIFPENRLKCLIRNIIGYFACTPRMCIFYTGYTCVHNLAIWQVSME